METAIQEVSALTAFRTLQTCGGACWHARELECSCYCGGTNHGILKTANGVAPTRMAKIDGHMYQIKAIGSNSDLYHEAKLINDNALPSNSVNAYGKAYPYTETEAGAPARLKKATYNQTQQWHEFRKFKGKSPWEIWRSTGAAFPYILWVRL